MQRVSSIFSQIVKLVPRGLFDEAVQRHQDDKHAKGMTCWSQFVAMLFCHLGVLQPPTCSTLSYANEHRSWQICEDLFNRLASMYQAEARGKRRDFASNIRC
jgi:hypothetical protein